MMLFELSSGLLLSPLGWSLVWLPLLELLVQPGQGQDRSSIIQLAYSSSAKRSAHCEWAGKQSLGDLECRWIWNPAGVASDTMIGKSSSSCGKQDHIFRVDAPLLVLDMMKCWRGRNAWSSQDGKVEDVTKIKILNSYSAAVTKYK